MFNFFTIFTSIYIYIYDCLGEWIYGSMRCSSCFYYEFTISFTGYDVSINISGYSADNLVMLAASIHIVNWLESEQPKSNQEVTNLWFSLLMNCFWNLNIERRIIALTSVILSKKTSTIIEDTKIRLIKMYLHTWRISIWIW